MSINEKQAEEDDGYSVKGKRSICQLTPYIDE
jgi:hypothetical protein